MTLWMFAPLLIHTATAVGDGAPRDEAGDASSGTADPLDPDDLDDLDEPYLDDGGLVDIGPPGSPLPPHWRVDLSVPAVRERAETAPDRGPWSRCIDPATVAGMPWDEACALVGPGASAADLSGRRAVFFRSADCTGASHGLPGAQPDPTRVPQALRGSLILRCPRSGPDP